MTYTPTKTPMVFTFKKTPLRVTKDCNQYYFNISDLKKLISKDYKIYSTLDKHDRSTLKKLYIHDTNTDSKCLRLFINISGLFRLLSNSKYEVESLRQWLLKKVISTLM